MALWSFGVFADVQYGDVDDEHSSSDHTRVKRFRQAPTAQLPLAVRAFNAAALAFVVNLGDIIEAPRSYAPADADARCRADLARVLGVLAPLRVPLYRHASLRLECASTPMRIRG